MAPFSVTVPPGVLPGQALHVQIGGHVVAVQVPPGTAPGAVLSIEVDLPGTQPQRPPRELAPPPEPAQAQDGTTGSCEKIFVVVATIFGFIGVIVSVVMLHNLEIGGEGLLVAIICLIAAACLGARLRKGFAAVDRELNQLLTPSEDTAMAVTLVLPHVAILAAIFQIYWSFMEEAEGTSVSASGSRVLFAVQLVLHLALGVPQVLFLRGLGRRWPAPFADNPHGGYLSWLFMLALPIVLLAIGFPTWTSKTCTGPDLVALADCEKDASVFELIAGSLLLLAAVGVGQASNRGWLATLCLPIISLIVAVWTAGREAANGDVIIGRSRCAKPLITPISPDFSRFFPVFPGTYGRARWIPGVQTLKMGEKWGKMGKKWVKSEITGVQKTALMHASAGPGRTTRCPSRTRG